MSAPVRLLGVIADGTRRKFDSELGRPHQPEFVTRQRRRRSSGFTHCFDSIPHEKLMACVEQRVADRSVLKLIRMWLNAPVREVPKGKPPTQKRSKKGTPQGGVISPLLANLYLHRVDRKFQMASGPGQWADARMVRYADDFVIMARYVGTRISDWVDQTVEEWMGLEINRAKTRIVDLTERRSSFDFLGYTFRYEASRYRGKPPFLTMVPSTKACKRERQRIKELTSRRWNARPVSEVVARLNRQVKGWSNYSLRQPEDETTGKAGCGKSARPV